ncbi:hypothetical protein PG985_009403 [Apiospora marii]|uniref:uncharacterized protein n=1 Tax=Apiospora marii TaxID=335849 RepID=UPI00312E3557
MPVLVVRVRPKTFPFLQLPREIRDVIYESVLVEPPKYQRRHKATCTYSSLTPTCAEKPPFCTEEVPHREHFCHCAKRRHLAVLLANRQIYDEGSRVLWQKNVFSFCSTERFHQWIASISAEKRSLIRHIAIYLITHWLQRRHVGNQRDVILDGRLLQTLRSCANLRRLDLGPARMPDGFVMTLSRQLPYLKSLRIAGFTPLAYLLSASRRYDNNLQAAADCTTIWGLVHVDVRIDDVHAEYFSPA